MASLFRNALRASATASSLHTAPHMIARPMVPSAFLKPTSFAARPAFVQSRVAAFHTSKSLGILPAGPQSIDGTINDAAPVPESNPAHGSYHWSFERLVSAALIPLTIVPFATGSVNPVMDAIIGSTVIIHSYIGFESAIIDYFSARKHPKLRKMFMWVLKSSTVLVLIGLYEFETNDVGITEAIKRVWKA